MRKGLAALAIALAAFAVAVVLFHDSRTEGAQRNADRLEIYYMYNEGESQQVWFDDAVRRFKDAKAAEGRAVEVDVVYAGREVLGKIRPRLIIGNPPDLVNQGADLLQPLMRDELLAPIDDALDQPAWGEDVKWKDTFFPGLLDLDSRNGHYYLAPVGIFAEGVFYDKAMFERLGLEPPRTWKEFLQVCQVLKDNGIAPIAADGTEPDYNVMWYIGILSRMIGPEGIIAAAQNKPGTSLDAAPFHEAARAVAELHDKGYIMKGYEGSKWPSAQMQWIQGKCGLLYNGTWIPKEMKEKTPATFRMGVFRFPIFEGYPEEYGLTQSMDAETFAIPKQARHKELAVEFLRFITARSNAPGLAAIDIVPSTVGSPMPPSLAGLDKYLSPPHKLTRWAAGIPVYVPEWFRTVARDNWSDLFVAHCTPEEMCRRVLDAHNRYYARREAMGAKPAD